MLSRINAVEECDATTAQQGTEAGTTILI